MSRVFIAALIFSLAACTHGPKRDRKADDTRACVTAASEAGVGLSSPPDDGSVVFGPYVVEQKIWTATGDRAEIVCVLHDRKVRTVTLGGEEVWPPLGARL